MPSCGKLQKTFRYELPVDAFKDPQLSPEPTSGCTKPTDHPSLSACVVYAWAATVLHHVWWRTRKLKRVSSHSPLSYLPSKDLTSSWASILGSPSNRLHFAVQQHKHSQQGQTQHKGRVLCQEERGKMFRHRDGLQDETLNTRWNSILATATFSLLLRPHVNSNHLLLDSSSWTNRTNELAVESSHGPWILNMLTVMGKINSLHHQRSWEITMALAKVNSYLKLHCSLPSNLPL